MIENVEALEIKESLIKESEEVIVSSPYHCFEDCYDVLGINKENGMVPFLEEDDYYWRYLGPPIYDSSRVGSIILEPLEHSFSKDDVHGHFQPFQENMLLI